MAKRPLNIRNKIIDSALDCASELDWGKVSLRMISDRASITLDRLYSYFSSKTIIAGAILDRTTEIVITDTKPSISNEPLRDRLLDNILQRFDAMEEHKAAIASIIRDTKFDPLAIIYLAPKIFDSMAWTLEMSGINSAGLVGRFRVKGLTVIYLSTLNTWVKDDSPDLTKTMAFLDHTLKQALQFASIMPFPIIDKNEEKLTG